ncbi:CLOCK-interacting pacemaker [Lampris incognitus]|uniref:CLOCK-interacting pacemaker n=1 Tax=Lampris incognitus TaxID=2546036 RepID=UPI0024B5BB5A|nr:CLOCK-interacting pacemaker [Lampris incognitus]
MRDAAIDLVWDRGSRKSANKMSTKRKAEGHSRANVVKLRTTKPGKSKTDSERDSGFSDAGSEHMSMMDTTDSEDSPRPVEKHGPSSGAKPSQIAVVGSSYSRLSPMIIMNNVLLKQPGDNPPALKPWGFSPTVEVVQPVVQQPQVVFLQPVVSHQTSSASKEASSRRRRSKKYLPILKSYPKIAPHPGDGSSSSGRGTSSSSSSSYSSSSSSGSERGSSLALNHQERSQKDKQLQKPLFVCPSNSGTTTPSQPAPSISVSPLLQCRLNLPLSETSVGSSPAREAPSPAFSQSEFSPSVSLTPSNHTSSSNTQTDPIQSVSVATQERSCDDEGNFIDGDPETKRKRFCNTYNILSKSGLLDITLRTKELLRQNRRTQSDLDRLKEHTNLFLQALRSGDTSIYVNLQTSLQQEDREKEREGDAQGSSKAD